MIAFTKHGVQIVSQLSLYCKMGSYIDLMLTIMVTTRFCMTSWYHAFERPKFCMTFYWQSVRKTNILYDFLLLERSESQCFICFSVGNAFGRPRFYMTSCCLSVRKANDLYIFHLAMRSEYQYFVV